MNLLVRGAGSVGKRHIKNAIALWHTVYASDPRPQAVAEAKALGALPTGPRTVFEAVIDATPPGPGRSAGLLPTLFEKPIATDADTARQVARCANPLSIVGYQLRFVPRIAELKTELVTESVSYARIRFSQALKDWRPNTDWRSGVSAHLGILLEASHELDLLNYLLGPWSWAQGWTSRTLGLPAEDVAVALVGLVNGGVAEVHLDMVRDGYERGVEVVGAKTHTVNLGLLSYGSEQDKNQPYLEELAAFTCGVELRGRDSRAASLEDGVCAVELVDAIRLSSMSGQRVFNGAEVEAVGDFIGRNWS